MSRLVWAFVAAVLGLNASLWIVVTEEKDEQLRQERAAYEIIETEAVRQRHMYLEERKKTEHLEKELANVKANLEKSQSAVVRLTAAEQRRAAAARASRSQRVASRASTKPSNASSVRSGSVRISAVSTRGAVRDITQYCATGNPTASGKSPRPGMVATLSRSIPFGTRVRIEGLGVYVVEDRIGHGSEFDIYTDSCGAARQFGRQHRRVTILD